MTRFAAILTCAFIAASASARVIYVDNRVTAPGDGSAERPFAAIVQAEGASAVADVLYVMETSQPYRESVALKRGQRLLGSAAGVEEAAIAPMQGPGPEIHGTITAAADAVIAGCTIVADGMTGIAASGANGTLAIRNVWFRTSKAGFAIFLYEQHGNVTISGGAIEATQQGSGLAIVGGDGDVVIEKFPIAGEFRTPLRIDNRRLGMIRFVRGTKLRVRDAADDAITITNLERPAGVIFDDAVVVQGRRAGLVVKNVNQLTIGGASTLATINGAALDVRDSTVNLSFESVSASAAAPGTLDEAVVVDRVHGRVVITGVDGKRGTGGAIVNAHGNGIRVAQTDNVQFAGVTITGSGGNSRIKGARCAGGFDVNSTAPCHAAVYLRHVTSAKFTNIVIDGGGAMGINANNIRDVAFTGVDIHGTGDETFESGALLQEVGGTVTFTQCALADNAGSELLIEQRFNSGTVVLDRCTLAAPQRPQVARQLLEIHATGAGRLTIDVRGGDLRDSIGSAIVADAAETSALALTVSAATMQHFGDAIISINALQQAAARFSMHDSELAAPAVATRPWVEVTAADRASTCTDISRNRFAAPQGTAIRLATAGAGTLRVVGAADAASLAAANGGAAVRLDAPPGAVMAVSACP